MKSISLSLGQKIPAIITGLVAVAVVATGTFSYYQGTSGC